MVIVWRKIDRYEQRGPDSLRRWVRAIIRLELQHTAFEVARLALLEAALLREHPRTPGLTPTTHVLYVESLVMAQEAIRKLSTRHQRSLVLGHPRRISESEGISVDAARMLLHRALRRLTELMRELRGEPRVRSITSG
jgi:DNA-directed RNA polymerase specialized sigma24 family protein